MPSLTARLRRRSEPGGGGTQPSVILPPPPPPLPPAAAAAAALISAGPRAGAAAAERRSGPGRAADVRAAGRRSTAETGRRKSLRRRHIAHVAATMAHRPAVAPPTGRGETPETLRPSPRRPRNPCQAAQRRKTALADDSVTAKPPTQVSLRGHNCSGSPANLSTPGSAVSEPSNPVRVADRLRPADWTVRLRLRPSSWSSIGLSSGLGICCQCALCGGYGDGGGGEQSAVGTLHTGPVLRTVS